MPTIKKKFPTRQNTLPDPSTWPSIRATSVFVSAEAGHELANAAVEGVLLMATVLGIDEPPRPMPVEEISRLGDVFTREILLKGAYPLTLSELVASIQNTDGGAAYRLRKLFLIAEGGQFNVADPAFELNARMVFTWQLGSNLPPDFMLSTVPIVDDKSSLLQLIAWSETDGSFHFFERKGEIWGWAGNSFHALKEPSRGKGPFDSHVNGGLVMKELKFPWAHWHSQSSSIPREAFPGDSDFHSDSLFAILNGAEELESIVKTGIRRWTKSRVSTELGGSTVLSNIKEYVRQIITPTSVNLVSSSMEFKRAGGLDIPLPSSFFLDVDGLELASMTIDPFSDAVPGRRITVDGTIYRRTAEKHGVHVEGEGNGTILEGDTHFCFLVPERAFEDLEVVRQLLERGILSARLLLSLLMDVFPNPVRSPTRASLLAHCPDILDPTQPAALDGPLVNSIRLAASDGQSPEMEFLSYWDDVHLLQTVKRELNQYVTGIQRLIETDNGVAKLVRYAEFRKSQFRNRLLNEFTSTTSQLAQDVEALRMNKMGNVVQDKI